MSFNLKNNSLLFEMYMYITLMVIFLRKYTILIYRTIVKNKNHKDLISVLINMSTSDNICLNILSNI